MHETCLNGYAWQTEYGKSLQNDFHFFRSSMTNDIFWLFRSVFMKFLCFCHRFCCGTGFRYGS